MAFDPLQHLANLFIKFPGIGSRQAKRFAYFVINQDPEFIKELTSTISDARQRISQCKRCFRLYTKNHSESPICALCNDPERDHTTLLIVEKDPDLNTIEKTGIYKGDYFVLGGLLPLLDEKDANRQVRSNELSATVSERAKDGLKEIIMAVSVNPEGDHTIRYLEHLLKPLTSSYSVTISILGRGLSTGTELEYSDRDTIYSALKNRQQS